MAVTFGLAEYHSGERILDLPVMEGASWSTMLNAPDALSCEIDLRDEDVRALDIPSSTEPKKTVLFASTEDGTVLAWGVISDREWDNDQRHMKINASGGWQYFHQRIIAPPAAATGQIVDGNGDVVTMFDTLINDVDLGSIGVALVEQALSWPGAPVAYVLPSPVADPGRTSGTYKFVDYKRVGAALDDLTKRVNGPDFAFDARRDATGLALEYVMRAGHPFLGRHVGVWNVGGPESPVTKLKVLDDGLGLATHIWMQSGRTDSKVIVSRAVNQGLIDFSGYPVLDLVDTSRTDVVLQETLDDYAAEHAENSRKMMRDVSFTVRGDAVPALGQYRPGDWAALAVSAGNNYLLEGDIPIRILGISGDERGDEVKIECDIGSMP